ncbi:type II toxin-antitoxin system RelE/ParE family toxin [Agrobacterium cavarae]
MHYFLSAEAEEDIIRIAEYGVRNFCTIHAQHYHDELFETLDLIARHPEMAREHHEIQPRVRIHPSNAHLIVYSVGEDGIAFVIRVSHGHEDWVGSDD